MKWVRFREVLINKRKEALSYIRFDIFAEGWIVPENRELTNRRLSHDGAVGSPYVPTLSSCRNLNLRITVKTLTFMRD